MSADARPHVHTAWGGYGTTARPAPGSCLAAPWGLIHRPGLRSGLPSALQGRDFVSQGNAPGGQTLMTYAVI